MIGSSWAPGLAQFRGYQRDWLRGDVVAGLTVAAYLVPQVMAYATVAGLPPVVGLWAALVPLAVYAVLGSSRQLSVGPESTTALMTATALGPLAAGDPAAAELVACECVVLAETKDHADWELIGECAKAAEGDAAIALQAAYDEVEDQEDEHLYHTKGWCRELWLQSLGLPAVLPPPEEKQHVTNAVEAAAAKENRRS